MAGVSPDRTWLRRITDVALIASTLMAVGCAGPHTSLKVPSCVERVEVTGEHRRVSDTRFVFDHAMEFPFTRTDIVVERTDGTTQTFESVNSMPDFGNLLGGALVGGLGMAFVALHASQVSTGAEAPFGPTFWLVPLGGTLFTASVFIGLTGWQPPMDIEVDTPCARGGQP